MCSITSRARHQAIAPVQRQRGVGAPVRQRLLAQRVQPFLHRVLLLLAQLLQPAELLARLHQRRPGLGGGALAQQQVLRGLQLARQRLAQFQVAVDHDVDQPQRQVGRALRQARARAGGVHAQARVGGQALDEADGHGAAGGVHADQQAVEHGKADRARVDAGGRVEGVARGGRRARFLGRGQAPEDHAVVDRGGVEVRGMGLVGQVARVQVQQGRAAQPLRQRLLLGQGGGVLGALQVHPHEAVGRRLRRHGVDEAQAAGGELDDVHGFESNGPLAGAGQAQVAICFVAIGRRRGQNRSARRRHRRA
jgi:hypothetical protein